MSKRRIEDAELDWADAANMSGGPRSFLFDDIYFSGDGPAESRHVFLSGNDLPARFENATAFVIGELGFGTGLNCLVAWDAWRRVKQAAGTHLHFLSVEKFPLSPPDMARAHDAWPEFASLSARLRSALPPCQPGVHQVALADDVTLTLLYGEAEALLADTEALVDVWFLDGFAPVKNPAMWSAALMSEVARLSNPGATFATFTVAGAVRRALESAGFAPEKRPGFGRKRDMLTGRIDAPPDRSLRAPWFDTRPLQAAPKNAHIAIIGAGIAGACLAHALRREGYAPVAYEATAPASGASGNPAALVTPRLDADDAPAGRFHAGAYLHTLRLLNALPEGIYTPCGALRIATTNREKERQRKLLERQALPADFMEARDNGLFFPQAGVVDPPALVAALLGDTPIRMEKVTRLCRDKTNWRVETAAGGELFDIVIIANGLDALRFAQVRGLPLSGSAGQIDWFPSAPAPDHAVAFGPYAAPAPPFSGDGDGLIIGATYAPVAIGATPRFSPEATETTLEAVRRVRPDLVAGLDPKDSRPRVSVRCTTPDRLPVVGAAPDWAFYGSRYDGLRTGRREEYPKGETEPGLFILAGLGSRGFATAALSAAMIAAEIAGAPAPVEASLAEAVHPARFFIRDLKRGTRKAG